MTTTRKTENSGTENSGTATPATATPTTATPVKKPDRAKVLKKMMNLGFHLGHPTRKWNPKMAPYLYGKLDGAHIIDITQSLSQMRKVAAFLRKASSEGKTFLFVGTKRQINQVVKDAAIACDALYVTQRWLGGMLTNLETMLPALRRLELLHLTEKSGMAEPPSRSAKEEARRLRKRERLEKYFGGLIKMRTIPDVVIIVGQTDERNAVLECKKLGITTVTLLDSDCDPTLTDFFVSANDDSPGSVKFVLQTFVEAICAGQNKKPQWVITEAPKPKVKEPAKSLILVRPKRPLVIDEETNSTKKPTPKKPSSKTKSPSVKTPSVKSSTKVISSTPSKKPMSSMSVAMTAALSAKSTPASATPLTPSTPSAKTTKSSDSKK